MRRPARYSGSCTLGTLVTIKFIPNSGGENERVVRGVDRPNCAHISVAVVAIVPPQLIRLGGTRSPSASNASNEAASLADLIRLVSAITDISLTTGSIGKDLSSGNIIETRFPSESLSFFRRTLTGHPIR